MAARSSPDLPATSQSNEQEDKHMANTDKTNILERLAEGITLLTSSERWEEWLTMQSRFHSYSFNNTLLILGQKPEASRVAGFNAWRKLDRFVQKGEKCIWILAPMVYKTDAVDEVKAEEPAKVIRGFKPVAVFDISQTDGAELQEVCARLSGEDDDGLYGRLCAVANTLGFAVVDADDLNGANGVCTHDEHRIQVLAGNALAQRVKTLAHELGHAILHAPGPDRPDNRGVLELEAESVAYVVCAAAGITSDDYSFGYVTTWSGGGDEAIAALKASGARIQQAADQILSAFDNAEQEGFA
jgi:antirestriction protein ArdC